MLLRNAGEELGWAAFAWVLWEGSAALALALSGGLWVASAVLALARLAVGLWAAPASSVALLLAPFGAGIRASGFGAPLGGAGIRAGGSDARPGGAHRSGSGSDSGPSPMGPVTDGTRIMGTTLMLPSVLRQLLRLLLRAKHWVGASSAATQLPCAGRVLRSVP